MLVGVGLRVWRPPRRHLCRLAEGSAVGGNGATQATLHVTGIANCRQAVGIPSLNAPMYRLHSSSLLILPTVLNPPSGSLKNAVQVVSSGSYAKQATFGPLYCCRHSAAVV